MKRKIEINGMSCGHCVMHVKNALAEVEGLTVLQVEIGKALVEGNASDETIKAAVEDMGYDVTSIKEI